MAVRHMAVRRMSVRRMAVWRMGVWRMAVRRSTGPAVCAVGTGRTLGELGA